MRTRPQRQQHPVIGPVGQHDARRVCAYRNARVKSGCAAPSIMTFTEGPLKLITGLAKPAAAISNKCP